MSLHGLLDTFSTFLSFQLDDGQPQHSKLFNKVWGTFEM